MDIFVCALGLFPYRVSGDKNFYHDCFKEMVPPSGVKIRILSFTGRTGRVTELGRNITLQELSRPCHPDEFRRYSGVYGTVPYFRHRHRILREVLERTSCLIGASRFIRATTKTKPAAIHFLDNFGPLMKVMSRGLGAPQATISTRPNAWPYGSLRGSYVRLSTGVLDRTGASSYAGMRVLEDIGIPRWKLARQRLGVKPAACACSFDRDRHAFLWTGFIPYLGRAEFKSAVRAVRAVSAAVPSSHHFHFAFKPESWRDEFNAYRAPGMMVERSRRPLLDQLKDAAALVSPLRQGSPLIPPLSWLEAMAAGVPVITNRVQGVEELVRDGWNGFVQQENESFVGTLRRAMASDLRAVGRNAAETICEEFTLQHAVQDLQYVWSEIT